jgi:hypothetical protein
VKNRKIASIMMAAALAVGTSAARVLAHAGNGDPSAVHACVSNKGGKMRIVGADASLGCKGNETPLHFAAQGEQGPPGPPGTPGRQGRSAVTPLQPGETASGTWGATVVAQSANEIYRAYATFPIPLVDAIADGNQVYVEGESAPHCPGQGQADAGYLCVYQGYVDNAHIPSSIRIFDPSTPEGPNGAGRVGFGIFLQSDGSGESTVSGTFSVTAP